MKQNLDHKKLYWDARMHIINRVIDSLPKETSIKDLLNRYQELISMEICLLTHIHYEYYIETKLSRNPIENKHYINKI